MFAPDYAYAKQYSCFDGVFPVDAVSNFLFRFMWIASSHLFKTQA